MQCTFAVMCADSWQVPMTERGHFSRRSNRATHTNCAHAAVESVSNYDIERSPKACFLAIVLLSKLRRR